MRALQIAVVVVGTSLLAFGQSNVDGYIAKYLAALRANNAPQAAIELGAILDDGNLLRDLANRAVATKFEKERMEKQAGEGAGGGGTTSLVAKSGIASVLSAAFESGALARKQEGTITTFRFNALALSCLSSPGSKCAATNPLGDTPGQRYLRGLSGAVSFDNEKTSTGTTAATAANFSPAPILNQITGGGRLSSASVRFAFLPEVVQEGNIKALNQAVHDLTPDRVKLGEDMMKVMSTPAWNDPFDAFSKKIQAAFAAKAADTSATAKDLRKIYDDALAETYADNTGLEAIGTLYAKIQTAIDKAFNEALAKPAWTLEYAHEAPSGQTAFSTFRFIGDLKGGFNKDAKSYDTLFTYNVALSVYESVPAGLTTGQWRSFQAAAEFERKLGTSTWRTRPTFSLAGYYQYQINNAILEFDKNALAPGTQIPLTKPAAEVLNTKGHIGIVQGKLTFKLTDTVSVPLAISWANRTELVKADTVRGQVGISLDLGNLMQSMH